MGLDLLQSGNCPTHKEAKAGTHRAGAGSDNQHLNFCHQTLDKSLLLSRPQFSHLCNGGVLSQ